ncbi:MAG: chromosome partitioning protein [Myxococcales bacterium]|nr:MAG: chromosome partitioning protein [Myxococcales bacterium]
MKPDELFSKRLLFFTGKGGVGKSTVVASLAVLAARRGKKALIVEIETASAMRRLFSAPFVGFMPLEVANNIWTININSEEALQEYVEEHVKIHRLAKIIVNNSILRYFFHTAPAVAELVTINKLYSLVHEKHPHLNGPAYDLILVDLPATGHALGFLDVPRVLKQLVISGPLRKIIDRYERLFTDPELTALNLVTLPADMPVTETIEMFNRLKSAIDIPKGLLIVNAMPDRVFDEEEAALLARLGGTLASETGTANAVLTGQTLLSRQQRSEDHIRRLVEQVKMTVVTAPRILSGRLDRDALGRLATAFSGALNMEQA